MRKGTVIIILEAVCAGVEYLIDFLDGKKKKKKKKRK